MIVNELAHATVDPRRSVCARGGVRTRTLLRGGGFKPPASANSATRAGVGSMLSHTSRERLRSNYEASGAGRERRRTSSNTEPRETRDSPMINLMPLVDEPVPGSSAPEPFSVVETARVVEVIVVVGANVVSGSACLWVTRA